MVLILRTLNNSSFYTFSYFYPLDGQTDVIEMRIINQQQINKTIISCQTKEANPVRNITWLFQNSSDLKWKPITYILASFSYVL